MSGLSYSRGPEAPLLEKTIPEVLSEMAVRLPNHEALVVRHQNARLTYRQLQQRVEEVARGLTGLGLKAGDRIGVWASGCVEWVLLFLACARTGIVQVNVNPAYRSRDLGFVLRKSKIKALFLHSRDARADYGHILGEAIAGKDLPLEHVVYLGGESWDAMLPHGVSISPTKIFATRYFQYSIHVGNDGFPQGRLADSTQRIE